MTPSADEIDARDAAAEAARDAFTTADLAALVAWQDAPFARTRGIGLSRWCRTVVSITVPGLGLSGDAFAVPTFDLSREGAEIVVSYDGVPDSTYPTMREALAAVVAWVRTHDRDRPRMHMPRKARGPNKPRSAAAMAARAAMVEIRSSMAASRPARACRAATAKA